ncbi:unnamed protein product, partial [Callosobruchus maculatus]
MDISSTLAVFLDLANQQEEEFLQNIISIYEMFLKEDLNGFLW